MISVRVDSSNVPIIAGIPQFRARNIDEGRIIYLNNQLWLGISDRFIPLTDSALSVAVNTIVIAPALSAGFFELESGVWSAPADLTVLNIVPDMLKILALMNVQWISDYPLIMPGAIIDQETFIGGVTMISTVASFLPQPGTTREYTVSCPLIITPSLATGFEPGDTIRFRLTTPTYSLCGLTVVGTTWT